MWHKERTWKVFKSWIQRLSAQQFEVETFLILLALKAKMGFDFVFESDLDLNFHKADAVSAHRVCRCAIQIE